MTSERIAKIVSMAFPVAIATSFLGFVLHISNIGDRVLLVLPIPILVFCALSLRKQRDTEATAFLAAFTVYVLLSWIGQSVYVYYGGASSPPLWADGFWLLGYLVLISAFAYLIFRFRRATGQTRILRPFALIPLLIVAAVGFGFGYAWHGLGDGASPIGLRLTTALYLFVDLTLAVAVLSLIPLRGDPAVRIHWVPLFSGILFVCAGDVFYALAKAQANLPVERVGLTALTLDSVSDVLYITGYLLYTVALIYAWSFESGGSGPPTEENAIGSLGSRLTLGAMHASIFLFALTAFEKICEELVKHGTGHFFPLENPTVQKLVSFLMALIFTMVFRATIGARLEKREKQLHDYMDGFRAWLRGNSRRVTDLENLAQHCGIDEATAEKLEKAVLFEQKRQQSFMLAQLKERVQASRQWIGARETAVVEYSKTEREIEKLRNEVAPPQEPFVNETRKSG
jgi:hypothetical protein